MSTTEIVRKGFSSKLAHVPRTHKISVAWTAEVAAQEFVKLLHCPTAKQKGDLFTKALDRMRHHEALDSIGMIRALTAALGSAPKELSFPTLPLMLALVGVFIQGG